MTQVQEIALWSKAHETETDPSMAGYYRLKAIIEEMVMDFVTGKPVYVRIEGKSRDGSIVKLHFNHGAYTKEQYEAIRAAGLQAWIDNGGNAHHKIASSLFGREATKYSEATPPVDWIDYIHEDVCPFALAHVDIRYDDGTGIDLPTYTFDDNGYARDFGKKPRLVWLKGYVGPTVKKFTKVAKAVKDAKNAELPRFTDMLGAEVKQGDCVVAHIGFDMVMATVDSLSATGKSITVIPYGKTEANRIVEGGKVVVLNPNTMDAAMLYKLKMAK